MELLKILPVLLMGIFVLSFVSAETSLTAISDYELSLTTLKNAPKSDIKFYQSDFDNVRIIRVTENKKLIGRDIIIKKDLTEKQIDKETQAKIKEIVDKVNRDEIVIEKPSLVIRIWRLIFK